MFICLSSFPLIAYAGGGESYSSFYKENGFNILYDGLLDELRMARTRKQSANNYNEAMTTQYETTKSYNVRVWRRFLNKSADEIEAIVYQQKLTADLPVEVSDYLRFVQLQEPLVNPEDIWNENPPERALRKLKHKDDANRAISSAEEQLQRIKTPFIRQRYVFLIVRLAHYSAQYDKALQLYDRYASDTHKLPNEVAQWIEALRAGALKRQGKLAESSYAFANVFAKTRTRKIAAHIDFRIKTDAQWKRLISLCKNNEEKALMHYMRALKTNANSLQELQQVYQLAPNSSWVNSLLLRELEFVQFARGETGIETQMLIDDIDRYKTVNKSTPAKITRRKDYLNELTQLVKTIKADNKRDDLFLVDYASLYLRLLSQKPIVVADVEAFQQKYHYTTRNQYATALTYFVYLDNLTTINEANERTISRYLEKIQGYEKTEEWEQNDLMDYTYIKLAPLYVKSKQRGKAYLTKQRGSLDADGMLVAELRDLNALATQKNPHLLIQKMNKSFKNMLYGNKTVTEIIARKYLAEGLFEKAKEKLQTLPKEKLWKTVYNPFTTSKSGNNRIKSTPKNLLDFTETLLTLEQEIATTPSAANAHFLLATAYYNMTWFGNSPMILRYHRSTYQWNEGEIDLSKSKKHYELALQYATDKELKIKALYALAKIEEKEKGIALDSKKTGRWPAAYDEYDYQAASHFKRQQGISTYFKKIEGYKETEYFNEVIKQCADYKFYSAR